MPRRTVARSAELRGTGLFSGRAVALRIGPAVSAGGITFRSAGSPERIPAHAEFHRPAARRTALGNGPDRVDTVEHLLAACLALGYDDLDIEVDGGEIPIGDGSFAPFVRLLEQAGTAEQRGPRRRARIARELTVSCGEARYAVAPARGLSVEVTLEYNQPVIGRQRFAAELGDFQTQIAAARTFGFVADIQRAQSSGELLGATTSAGIALEPDRVMNTVLHWPDEFVRHKAGDLIGDLALIGARLDARVTAVRPSHEGNFACVQAILAEARYLEE